MSTEVASPTETVSHGIEPITMHRHDSAESIMRSFWSFATPDIFEDADAYCLGDVVIEEGKAASGCTPNEMKTTLEEAGFWAYADTPKRIIHVWSTETRSRADLLALIGHEIGHLVGVPLEDESAEEDRANSYGYAAALASEFAEGAECPKR